METIKRELLDNFGKMFVEKCRDLTIQNEFKIIEGTAKSPLSKQLHEKLQSFTPNQLEIIKDLIIDSIDGALNNFLWLLEQENKIQLVSFEDDRTYLLKEISDGHSVDYWNFVDGYSKYKRVD